MANKFFKVAKLEKKLHDPLLHGGYVTVRDKRENEKVSAAV